MIVERIRAVLAAEAAAIEAVVVTPAYEKAVLLLAECHGKVVTTGMGKAGLIARKFAATLCSTGTPALFLHPGEAAHGDLGVLDERDLIVAFSTSGKTAEVLETIAAAGRMRPGTDWPNRIIGITSHPDSALRQQCDLVLDMGVMAEPCPLGLTPSASTTVMLAISDALALAVLELKDVRREDFGRRHRAGYLGLRSRIVEIR